MSNVTQKTLVRWLSLLAVLVLCIAGFAGCGGTTDPVSEASSDAASETEATDPGTDPTDPNGTTDPSTDTTDSSESGGDILRPTESGGKTTNTTLPQPTVPPTPAYDFLANFPKELSGTTIKFLTWFAPDAVLQKQIADFTEKTGVKVNVVQTTWGIYPTRLASMVGSNSSPDVASIQPDWWPSLIVKNYFQEISVGNFDLANDPAYDLDSMNLCSWGGKYYGVSIKNSTWCNAMHVILYNKTLFRRENLETPTELWIKNEWNWDTYLKAAKALTKTKDGVKHYGTAVAPVSYMLSAGTDFVKFQTTGNTTKIVNNLSDPKLEMAWKFYIQTRNRDYVEPLSSSWDDFLKGTIAMVDQEDYYLLNGSDLSKMTDEWGAVPFPSPKGQEMTLASSVKIWGIPTGSKKGPAASYFIRYFLDPNTEPPDDPAHPEKNKFINSEAKDVFERLCAIKKNALLSLGVLSYNTDSDFWSLFTDVAYGEYDQVGTNLKSYDNKVNSIIKNIEDAMPK